MSRTKNSYKRISENIRVSGFSTMDTYEEFVCNAGRGLFPKKSERQLKKAAIILSNARVLNMPVHGEPVWTLGGYLYDSGGSSRKNKMVFGIYLSDSESEEVCERSHLIKIYTLIVYRTMKTTTI